MKIVPKETINFQPKPKLPGQNETSFEVNRDRTTMSNVWSGIIFILNIWTLFTCLLWASLHELPTEVFALIHIVIECILFFEVIMRILLRQFLPTIYENFNLHHMGKRDPNILYMILLMGSFPIMTLYAGISVPNEASKTTIDFARILLIKLLRSYEIPRAIGKVEEILFYKRFKTLVLVKFIKNFIILLFVTHIFTCAFLLVQSSITNHAMVNLSASTNSENPFGTALTYFARNGEENAPLIQKYMDACLWAVGTLAACSFGDVTPRTFEEVLLSLITLLTGVVLLAMIFSDFAKLMYLVDIERAQARKQLQKALKLCEILKVPFKIRYKIQSFYDHGNSAFSQTQYLPSVRELPKSLHTDIVLSINKDVISKINVFNYGSPDLLIEASRMFYPKVSMAGDFVLRAGDDAEEMFFIKQGEVEVLANDNKTRIAILREGAYFGEIGLLLTQKRTVSIRALTVCVFEVLNKEQFTTLLEGHPEQQKLLLQVANQRIKICSPDDIIKEAYPYDSPVEASGIYDTDFNENAKGPKFLQRIKEQNTQINTETSPIPRFWRDIVIRFRKYACINKDSDFRNLPQLLILPASKFYYIWTVIVGAIVFANLLIIPYEISFGLKYTSFPVYWQVIDVIVAVLQFVDIFVHMNTSIKKKNVYVSNKDYVIQKYFNQSFILDLLAFIPLDYITMALNLSRYYTFWVKITRLAKIPRLISMLLVLREDTEKKNSSFFLIILAICYISFNHIAACVMHMIANNEYNRFSSFPDSDEKTLYQKLANRNTVDMPLTSQDPSVQYIYFIYWAFSVSSSGSFGDVVSVTPFEKFFEIVTVLFFKTYFAFIAAEVASIFTSAYVSFKENLDKKTMYLKWMTHIKLPVMLSKRVIAFNEHVFTKYKGLDENKILAELPSTTRNEIMEFLLADLIETAEIFPKDEIGLFSSIIKGFRFQIVTKNEFVFRAGETAEEIFFILYGEVAIEKEEGHKVFAHLKKNDFFGEISLLEGKVGVRTKCVRAKTDLTLAVLHLTHLKEVWKKYPTVKEKMAKIAEIRQQLNQKNENEIREEQLVDSETVKEHSSGQKADNVSEFDQLRREIEEGDGLDQSPPAARKRNAPIMKESPEFLRSLSGNDPQQTKASAFDNIAKETGERNVWDNSVAKPRPSSRSYLNPRDAGKGKSELFTLSQSEMTAKPRDRDRDSESLNYISDVNNKVGGSYVNFPTPSKGKHETPESHGKLAMIVKAYHKFEERFKIVRPLILNLILFFDVILAPLNIALEVATSGPLVYVELTFASILLFNFLLNLKDLIKNRKNVKKIFPASVALAILNPTPTANKENHHNKEHSSKEHHEGKGHNSHHDHVTLTTVCLDFIFMIPFTVIFHAFHVHGSNTNALLIGIQLVKLFAVEHLTWIFQQEAFKKRYALNNILMILYAFVILNHLVACLFIIMANVKEDVNTTWYAKVPAPQFEFPNNVRTTEEFEEEVDDWTIYIHALYWAYMTTSHIGIGDISAINHDEKIFASIVIMISSFIYAFLFGNLASLVDDLTPKFQKEFENNYRNVLEYAKTSKLDHFLDKIHKYYNYIWQDNKGIDEDEILSTLPNSLRYDIFHARYESVISSSKFFKNQDGSYNSNIFYSFCKKMKYRVFMESDFIVVAGQEVGDVYIILEGEAEVVQYHIDTQNAAKYSPGDHIGGMIPNMVQLQNIKASKITKVAILSQESFLELKEAYPEWYAHIMKSTPLYKLMHHFINTFKQSITESGKKPKVKEINQIKDNLKEMRINSAISKKRMVDDQSRPQGQRKKTDQSYVINDDQANKNAFDSKRRNFRERDSIQNSVNVNEGVKRSTFFKVNPDNSQQGPAIQSDSESHPEDQPIEHKDSNNAWVDLIDPLDPLNSGTTPLAQSREGASFRHSRFRKKETMSDSTVPRVGPPPIMTSPSYLDPQSFNVQKSKSPKPNCFALIMKKMTSLLFKPKDILSRPSLQNDAASDRDLPIRMPSLKKEKSKSPTKLPRKSIFGNLMGRKESSGESEDQNGKDEEKDFELELKGHLSKALSGGTSFRTNTFVPKLAEIIHDTKKLDQHMRALKYYINPNSIWKTIYEMIHTFSIIYSVFAVPLYVGFDLDISDGFVVMEVLIFVELIVYPICLMRTAQYAYGILRLNPMQVWKKFIRKGFVTYLLALLPMNLIFRFGGISIPVWLSGILRINRVLLVTKTSTQFAFFGSKYPQITRMLNVLKPTFYLAFVSHFISCLFSWTLIVEPNTSTEETFTEFLELGKDSLSRRYMIALDFILSIATTTGYPELIVYNNYERLTCIFLVYLGDAVFALILGWYSSNSTALPEKYNYVFERIRKMEYILQAKRIPHKIRTKVENYFAYIVDTRNSNKSCLEALSGLLPPTTLRDMACDQASVFKTLPLLKELNNKVLVKEILQNLKQSIYLPHDYIITRNEYGSEMYCIAEGTVHMLSPNEKKVLAVLQTGAFFGELGVYTTTKRLTSFVADSFCLIYILDKEIFRKIMKSFPQADYDYKQFAQRKFAEGNSATVRANDQLHKAYTNLHALANTAIASSSQPTPDIAKLLRSAEVPRFLLRVPDDRRVSISDQFLLASQRTPREEKVHAQFKEDGEDIPLTSLVDDCIEDEEIDQRGIDLKKNSFRIKTKTRERRFSRLQLGKEKSVSKSQGLTIRWGLNLQ